METQKTKKNTGNQVETLSFQVDVKKKKKYFSLKYIKFMWKLVITSIGLKLEKYLRFDWQFNMQSLLSQHKPKTDNR